MGTREFGAPHLPPYALISTNNLILEYALQLFICDRNFLVPNFNSATPSPVLHQCTFLADCTHTPFGSGVEAGTGVAVAPLSTSASGWSEACVIEAGEETKGLVEELEKRETLCAVEVLENGGRVVEGRMSGLEKLVGEEEGEFGMSGTQ